MGDRKLRAGGLKQNNESKEESKKPWIQKEAKESNKGETRAPIGGNGLWKNDVKK